MKEIEDIIRDRLAIYESDLPEGSLAGFRKKLDAERNSSATASGPSRAVRRSSPLWLAVPAFAAGLALLLVYCYKDVVVDIDQGSSVVESVNPEDVSIVEDRERGEPQIFAETVSICGNTFAGPGEMLAVCGDKHASSEIAMVSEIEPEGSDPKDEEAIPGEDTEDVSEAIEIREAPFTPESEVVQIKSDTFPLAAIGGTSAIAIAALAPTLSSSLPFSEVPFDDMRYVQGSRPITSGSAGLSGVAIHRMPLSACLSLRVPVSDRWSITTEVGFLSYTSLFELTGYSDLSAIKQVSQYLNLSARMDYTVYSNDVFDIYAGIGTASDFCIAATLAGTGINHDGVGFSLLASAGFQLNLSEHIGIFIEPLLSWSIPSDKTVLQTYRTAHPLMFSVNPGLRFTLPHE